MGMGKDWVETSTTARDLASQADRALGFSLSEIMFEGPDEELTKTSRCQPALYLHGMMGLALIRERLPHLEPVAAAGLSLGEFTAHAAAGSFSFEDGLRLVARRGEFMEEACKTTEGAMAALIGGEESQVVALAAATGDRCRNCASQRLRDSPGDQAERRRCLPLKADAGCPRQARAGTSGRNDPIADHPGDLQLRCT